MPIKGSPQQATQKWVNNISQASANITSGVNSVQQAPGAKAAGMRDKWLQKVTAAAPKWQANTAAVTLDQWKSAMINVGIPRIASGANAKQGKMLAFMSQFYPYLQTGVDQIHAMPSTTLQDNINRAIAMINYNAKFKRNPQG